MRTFILLCFAFLAINAFGQEITVKNGFFGLKYYQDEVRIKEGQVLTTLKPFNEQYQLFANSRKKQIWGDIIQIPGGFMVGWQLGNMIADRPTNTTLGIIGSGLIVVGTILSATGIKGKKKAISEFNMLQHPHIQNSGVELKIQSTAHGFGLHFGF